MTKEQIAHLHDCVEDLKKAVAANAIVIDQIKTILDSFRILGAVARWVGAVGVVVGAVIGIVKSLKGG